MAKYLEHEKLEKLYEDVKEATKAISSLDMTRQPKEFKEFLTTQTPLESISDNIKELYDIEENSTDQNAKSTIVNVFYHLSMHLPKQVASFLKKAVKFLPTFLRRKSQWDSLVKIWMAVLCDVSDKHERAKKSCCRDGLVSFIFKEMGPRLTDIEWGKGTLKESIKVNSMGIVYNCSKISANHNYYRKVNAVDKLVKLRNNTNEPKAKETNLLVLLTLGYLIDESNSNKIICGNETIDRLISYLKECLQKPKRIAYGFHPEELAEGLKNYSGPDKNKQLICKSGGHEVLAALLLNAMNDEEIIASCNALWSLCFTKKGRLLTKENQDLMKKLKELSESEKSEVKKAADGVLWQVKQVEEKEKTADADSGSKSAVNGAGHIMLSYQWDDQKMVKDIAAALKEREYIVWIDVEKIQGNIMDAMADAVEQASVIVVCISRKYKNSPNCRAEADYSFQLKKKVIPLMMEEDYKPDGWLGLLLGSKLRIDFTCIKAFAQSIKQLCSQLDKICPALPEAQITQHVEEPVQAVNKANLGHHPLTSYDIPDSGAARTPLPEIKHYSINHKRIGEISQWSNNQVHKWLGENSLTGAMKKDQLEKLTGVHLVMLHKLQNQCPKKYYDRCEVRQELGFNDLLDFLEFTNHIDKLLE